MEEISVIPLCSDPLIFVMWRLLTSLYKFALNIAGVVLVVLTRNIKATILNEVNYLPAIIITNAIFMTMIVALLFVADVAEAFNLWRLVWGTLLFVPACIFLGLTFVPKVLH